MRDWRAARMPRIRDALIRDFRDAYRAAKQREAQHGAGPWVAGESLVWAADALNIAEMFWVTSDMARMATDASQDIPAFTPALEWPHHSGLLLFAEPPASVEIPASDATRRAAAAGGATIPNDAPISGFAWRAKSGELTIEALTDRRHLAGLPMDKTDGLVSVRTVILGADDEIDPSDRSIDAADAQVVAMLGACWILSQMPTVASVEHRQAVASSDGKRSPQLPQEVRIIDLRQLRQAEPTQGERGTDRHLSVRFIVRGHWRNQAVGPKRGQRRPTWVPSYVKGPPDAPFQEKDHVFVWRR